MRALRPLGKHRGFDSPSVDVNQFSGLNLTNELCADEVKRTGFRSDHGRFAELAENKRSDAIRVSRGNKFLLGAKNERVRSLDEPERFKDGVAQRFRLGACDEMQNDFRIGRRLKDGS